MKLTSKTTTTNYRKLMAFHQKKKGLTIGVVSVNSKIMGLGKFSSDLDISKALIMHSKDSFLCVSYCFEPGSRPLHVKDFSNCHPGWSSYDSRTTQLTTYWWPKTLNGCQKLEWPREHSDRKTARCQKPLAFNEGAIMKKYLTLLLCV